MVSSYHIYHSSTWVFFYQACILFISIVIYLPIFCILITCTLMVYGPNLSQIFGKTFLTKTYFLGKEIGKRTKAFLCQLGKSFGTKTIYLFKICTPVHLWLVETCKVVLLWAFSLYITALWTLGRGRGETPASMPCCRSF